MNIFQKIREVKLPFLAVVAALAFGGIVAPANAAAPAITTTALGASGQTTQNVSYATDIMSGTCTSVVRLTSATALSAADVIARTALGSGDVFIDTSRPAPGNFAAYINVTGLASSSAYTFYVACTDGSNVSVLATRNFTTDSPATQITFNANRPAGVTVTVTGMPSNNPANNFGAQLQTMMMGQSPFLAGYTFDGWQTSPNGGTLYSVMSSVPTSSSITLYAKWTVIGGPSQPQQQAPTTATVRPLPQINFAANPVNGVSARPTADTRKGTLTIEGSNLSDLTSITIGGKAATFTVKDGKLDIKLPAGVTGFPEVVMTNASGSITMQNAIEIYAPTVQKLTKFVGERLTLAGMEVLENLYINNKTATALEATVVVAPDATEAEIAKAVAAATKAVTYIDKVGKRIVRTAVTVSKTGEAGTKPAIEMSFTK